MSKDGEKVSKLQVIDPVLLTSILRRVDENTKQQSVSNALDESGLNKIISDYDKYLKLSSDSGLKDTFRMNLLCWVANFKEKAKNREASSSGVGLLSGSGDSSGDGLRKAGNKVKHLFETKSVRDFKNALHDSGFREGEGDFMASGDGESTGIKYRDVLNDFGANLPSSKSYRLSDRDKLKVFNLLKKTGFNKSGIKNASLRVAYDVRDVNRSAFRSQVKKTTPLKEKRHAELMGGPSRLSRNIDSSSSDSSDGLYVKQKLTKYK